MRQKRAKAYKKQMGVYVHTFKFREPFQTIVDDELTVACTKSSFDLVKGINRTISAECKPMITQCCMQALYSSDNQQAIELAKTFERRRCNHPPKDPKPPAECIELVTSIKGINKHRYVVATQNYELRKKLRQVPGVPLIFMNRSVMVMEPLSKASAAYSQTVETEKLTGGLNSVDTGYKEEPKKKKGPKEPNPLSIKKRKVEKTEPEQETKKRKRKHKKKSEKDGEENETEEDQDRDEKEGREGEELEKTGNGEPSIEPVEVSEPSRPSEVEAPETSTEASGFESSKGSGEVSGSEQDETVYLDAQE